MLTLLILEGIAMAYRSRTRIQPFRCGCEPMQVQVSHERIQDVVVDQVPDNGLNLNLLSSTDKACQSLHSAPGRHNLRPILCITLISSLGAVALCDSSKSQHSILEGPMQATAALCTWLPWCTWLPLCLVIHVGTYFVYHAMQLTTVRKNGQMVHANGQKCF